MTRPWKTDGDTGDLIVQVDSREVEINFHEQPTDTEGTQALRVVIGYQLRQLHDQGQLDSKECLWLTCVCGRRVALSAAYRCLYCGLWLCKDCAIAHFGPKPEAR